MNFGSLTTYVCVSRQFTIDHAALTMKNPPTPTINLILRIASTLGGILRATLMIEKLIISQFCTKYVKIDAVQYH